MLVEPEPACVVSTAGDAMSRSPTRQGRRCKSQVMVVVVVQLEEILCDVSLRMHGLCYGREIQKKVGKLAVLREFLI